MGLEWNSQGSREVDPKQIEGYMEKFYPLGHKQTAQKRVQWKALLEA